MFLGHYHTSDRDSTSKLQHLEKLQRSCCHTFHLVHLCSVTIGSTLLTVEPGPEERLCQALRFVHDYLQCNRIWAVDSHFRLDRCVFHPVLDDKWTNVSSDIRLPKADLREPISHGIEFSWLFSSSKKLPFQLYTSTRLHHISRT